jgi:hypothetical protein
MSGAFHRRRARERRLAWAEIVRIRDRFGITGNWYDRQIDKLESQHFNPGGCPRPLKNAMVREAIPHLERLTRSGGVPRYEVKS